MPTAAPEEQILERAKQRQRIRDVLERDFAPEPSTGSKVLSAAKKAAMFPIRMVGAGNEFLEQSVAGLLSGTPSPLGRAVAVAAGEAPPIPPGKALGLPGMDTAEGPRGAIDRFIAHMALNPLNVPFEAQKLGSAALERVPQGAQDIIQNLARRVMGRQPFVRPDEILPPALGLPSPLPPAPPP